MPGEARPARRALVIKKRKIKKGNRRLHMTAVRRDVFKTNKSQSAPSIFFTPNPFRFIIFLNKQAPAEMSKPC